MVVPLRTNTVSCNANTSVDGMYIVGRSNARGLNIPHLPRIVQADMTGDGLAMAVDGVEEIQPISLKCDDLFDNFSDGDIVWVNSRANRVRTVLSSRSTANTLLLTEQCENRCLFCSQPPNHLEDIHLYHQAAIALLNFNSPEIIGLSGGEPTHNESAFIKLLAALKQFKNNTELHILSNGRRFKDIDFTHQVMKLINNRSVLWGIPLYGHYSDLHDHLVGADGAFIDTVRGLSNLSSLGQFIELRIVPVSKNLPFLNNIIEFITSNYLNIKIISVMNLEPKGYARKNFDSLYVKVAKQVPYLEQAVLLAERSGLQIRLFNYPLCALSEPLRSKAAKSISDWKNYYADECELCKLQPQCGGLFTSSTGQFLENIRSVR